MINIEAIWDKQIPAKDIITRTKINQLLNFNCFIATNRITGQRIYIMSIDSNVSIPDLKNYRFKGLTIFKIKELNRTEIHIYLLDNSLKDVFSLFIQNLLNVIESCATESEAFNSTLNLMAQWKQLFSKINSNCLTEEQQKGLIGELLFFNYLLENNKKIDEVFNAWVGLDFEDKDFIFDLTGIEIKLTTSKYPKINITNERQLDIDGFNNLYLILYIIEEGRSDNGFSLNSLIKEITDRISTIENRNFFYEKLTQFGYSEHDKEYYNATYFVKKVCVFSVEEDFPKITQNYLPSGIYNTSYCIEISSIDKFIVNQEDIIRNI